MNVKRSILILGLMIAIGAAISGMVISQRDAARAAADDAARKKAARAAELDRMKRPARAPTPAPETMEPMPPLPEIAIAEPAKTNTAKPRKTVPTAPAAKE